MVDRRAVRFTLGLIVASFLLGDFVADLNRTLIEMPAWRQLGPEAWAAFSRLADLGNGRTLYPIAGIGGTLLTLAAAVAFRFSPRRPWWAAVPVYGAALMNIGVILLTTQAAPVMLSLRHGGTSPVFLEKTFEAFYRWDSIRAVVGMVGDWAAAWSLAAIAMLSVRCEDRAATPGSVTINSTGSAPQ